MAKVSICIDVPDLRAATAFYSEALGLSIEKQQPSHDTLSAGGVSVQLLLKDAGSTTANGASRTYERHWTPVHLDFDVDDLDAAVEAVKRANGVVESVQRGDWGGMAVCADPFGNGFCLVKLA
jgi:predicted enzyme related to lactoylglutathione lyase